MYDEYLRKSLKDVILTVGDLIIDIGGGHIGVLVRRTHRIDIIEDDVYIWEILWIRDMTLQSIDVPRDSRLEEDNLKTSIIMGIYDWFPVTGEQNDI